MVTQLNHLRTLSAVDCDTLSLAVASSESLGRFTDGTSNQAIAYFELTDPSHSSLILDCASLSQTLSPQHPSVPIAELAVEVFQVHLGAKLIPHISGRVLVQTNPFHSFSAASTASNARRIISHFSALGVGRDRVAIKIPATWEGLQAIRVLEQEGITCLATTTFTMAQCAVAGQVGATYVAPYVNDLRVHFDEGFKEAEERKGFAVCARAQKWYQKRRVKTMVMPASLISADEVMRLRGLRHITITPRILEELAKRDWTEEDERQVKAELDSVEAEEDDGLEGLAESEEMFRIRFVRELAGIGNEKLGYSIDIFCGFQEKLEQLAEDALAKCRAH